MTIEQFEHILRACQGNTDETSFYIVVPIDISNFLTSFLMSGRPAAAQQYRQTRPGSPMCRFFESPRRIQVNVIAHRPEICPIKT
jgi:hypothetical protein